MKLDEFLKHYAREECIQINKLIRKGDGTYKGAMLSLIKSHKADKKNIARWEKKCSAEMTVQFNRIMNEVKQLELEMSPLQKGRKAGK